MMKAVERCTLIFIGFLLGTGRCFAQPTELFNCLEDGSYCSETPLDTLASLGLACGEDFHVFVGRVAFPPLINRGPITIAVKSLSPHFYYRYPLYVEIVGRLPTDPPVCTTFLAGALVLVVGAEVQSTALDVSTRGRDVAVIFGDGAGAALLEATEEPDRGVLSTHLHADGRYARDLWTDAPGSFHRPRVQARMLEDASIFPRMEGQKVFKHAIVKMPEVVREALAKNGLTPADLKVLIPHQANLRISEVVQKALELRDDQVFNNIQKYGNTTAASIPLCLAEAVKVRGVKRGDLVGLCAFGAGFTWASALVRW